MGDAVAAARGLDRDELRAEVVRLLKWGLKSVGGLAANLALLTLWVDIVGFAAWWAVGINWVLLAAVGYVVAGAWVFDGGFPSGWGHLRRFVGMQSVMTASKAVNYAIYVGLLGVGTDYRVAWAAGAVVTFAGSYGGNRWLWRKT